MRLVAVGDKKRGFWVACDEGCAAVCEVGVSRVRAGRDRAPKEGRPREDAGRGGPVHPILDFHSASQSRESHCLSSARSSVSPAARTPTGLQARLSAGPSKALAALPAQLSGLGVDLTGGGVNGLGWAAEQEEGGVRVLAAEGVVVPSCDAFCREEFDAERMKSAACHCTIVRCE